MVRISELHEPEDDSMEHLNLDDYNSDDYDEFLSDNMETTPPAVTEIKATIKQDPPAPPPAVTVTVQLEEQPAAEDLYERCRLLNQKRAFRHQRVVNRLQEQQGDNYDYSNSDLSNVINIGRDARNVIISRKKKREEIEAYIPSSNYRIPAHASASFKSTSRQVPFLKASPVPNAMGKHLLEETGSTKCSYASASCTLRAPTQSSSATHSIKPLEHPW